MSQLSGSRRRCASPPAASPRARPRPHGFTLIELLIALVLAALCGTMLTVLLASQQRMYAVLDTRVRVQRNLRTGVSVLPADLRSASVSQRDLVALQDTMVELRATIGSSIVCGIPNKSQIDLPPLNASKNVLSTWYSVPVTGDTVWVYDENVKPTPEDDRWSPYRITAFAVAPTSGAVACANSAFLDPTQDAATAKPRYRVTLSDTLTDSVRLGAGVRFTRRVRYSLYTPAGASAAYLGYAESSASGWSAPNVLAGPFHRPAAAGRGGIAFAYFDSTGAAIAAPVATADLVRVSRVDVTLRSTMQPPRTIDTLRAIRDSARVRVALRNRQ